MAKKEESTERAIRSISELWELLTDKQKATMRQCISVRN